MAGGLAWYYRYGKERPYTGLILSALPLFFAWRSLWNYFYYVGLITFAAILADTGRENGREPRQQQLEKGSSGKGIQPDATPQPET